MWVAHSSYTCKTASSREKQPLTQSYGRYWHWNIETARRKCSRACACAVCDGLNEKRCESEWCPPFWILISSSDISTLTPPPPHPTPSLHLLFSTSTHSASSHPFLPRSFPSHRSVLETGYEELCYLITDQRARENEWGRKTEKEYVLEAKRQRNSKKMRDGERRGERFFAFIHLLFPKGLVKHHGPNWTNDCAQIRLALINKWMRK